VEEWVDLLLFWRVQEGGEKSVCVSVLIEGDGEDMRLREMGGRLLILGVCLSCMCLNRNHKVVGVQEVMERGRERG
jgi:hypothetical protein